MISARQISDLHDQRTSQWHQDLPLVCATGESEFLDQVTAQHLANFELWHEEDRARIPGAPERTIAEVKRAIDRINQHRNDLAEGCDAMLLAFLAERNLPNPDAELHSETPGLIIDRLSILSLKLYHTREEIGRPDAPTGHRERNEERHRILLEQRADLAHCLDHVWVEVLQGRRRFKLYRQLKMYNDPTLNPEVYTHSAKS